MSTIKKSVPVMQRIRQSTRALAVIASLTLLTLQPTTARADLFGGDVVVLTQILAQTIQQLAQLRQILSTGRDSLDLVRDINRGINDSLQIIRTISPNGDPGLYREWGRINDAIQGIAQIYGAIASSPESRIQRDTDQSVAEAVTLNNSVYTYTQQIDQIGESIKSASHAVSPGGAQKLTAQSLGILLHVMNQSLRTQATGLKLQAQALALQNHRDKEMTRHLLQASDSLKTALKSQSPEFNLPRF